MYLWIWSSAWQHCYSTREQQGLESPYSVTKAPHGALSHCWECLPVHLISLAACTLGQEPSLIPLLIITVWHGGGTQQMCAEWTNEWIDEGPNAHTCWWGSSLCSGFPRSLLGHACPRPPQSPHSTETSQTSQQPPFLFAEILLIERMQFWELTAQWKYFLESKGNLSWNNRKFLNTWVEDHSPLQPLWFPLQSWTGFLLNSPACFVVHYSRDEGEKGC